MVLVLSLRNGLWKRGVRWKASFAITILVKDRPLICHTTELSDAHVSKTETWGTRAPCGAFKTWATRQDETNHRDFEKQTT